MIVLLALLLVELSLSVPYPSSLSGAPRAAIASLALVTTLFAGVDDLFRRGGWLNRFGYLLAVGWFFSRWPAWASGVEAVYVAAGPGGPVLAMTVLFMVVAPIGLLLCPALAWARGNDVSRVGLGQGEPGE